MSNVYHLRRQLRTSVLVDWKENRRSSPAIFAGGQIAGEIMNDRQSAMEKSQRIEDLSKDIKEYKEEPGVALG